MKELRIYLQSNEITEDKLYELDKFLCEIFNTEDVVITTEEVKEINIPKAAKAYIEANYVENSLSKEFLEAANIPKELWPLRYAVSSDELLKQIEQSE